MHNKLWVTVDMEFFMADDAVSSENQCRIASRVIRKITIHYLISYTLIYALDTESR